MILNPRTNNLLLLQMSINNAQRDIYHKIQSLEALTDIDIIDVKMYAKRTPKDSGILQSSSTLIIGSCISDSLYQKDDIREIIKNHSVGDYLDITSISEGNASPAFKNYSMILNGDETHQVRLHIFPESVKSVKIPAEDPLAFYLSKIQ